jgi:hypothetical protein
MVQRKHEANTGLPYWHRRVGGGVCEESFIKETAGDLPGHFRPADWDEADRRAVVARQSDAMLREQLGAKLDAFTQGALQIVQLGRKVDTRRGQRRAEHRGLNRAAEDHRPADCSYAPFELRVREYDGCAACRKRLAQRRRHYHPFV